MNYCPQLTPFPRILVSSFLKCPIKRFGAAFGRKLINREPDSNVFPKSGALAYLHHESDIRKKWCLLRCALRKGRTMPHSSEAHPAPTREGCSGSWIRSQHPKKKSEREHLGTICLTLTAEVTPTRTALLGMACWLCIILEPRMEAHRTRKVVGDLWPPLLPFIQTF